MRIAHIESSMDWGGQELRIVEQSEWLNREGHPTWVIARPGSAILEQARGRGVPTHAMEIRGSVNPVTYRELSRFLKRERIELLDCHGNRDSTYGAYVKWLQQVPVVRSRHVTDPIRADALRRLIWRRGNDGIVVTAGKIREMLAEAGLAESERVYVAAAGVDESRFSPERDGRSLRERLGIPLDHMVIANVGMIRPDKGQLYFVRACKELLVRHAGITCIQLGEATGQTADYKEAVLHEAGSALDAGRIRFLGYQPDIENWLAVADLVVVASVATEAQTRLVAQAFLMKKNIVATTTGGLPEMIDHQRTGLLCPPGNAEALAAAIDRLLAEPGLAANLREAAYQHALQYMSFDYMMQGMLGAYRQAVRRAGRNLA
ncbi:glycosyltransferase family 4 protein [Pseudogulbenkiania subflava]|uniref:Glycosyltransferase involved in cell wall bisynthesis n=1 Tax=Pseudogulbenkiania subflava DSM 22618 TaxID=1123014 RepID=A0A1Y6BCG4_9NEIS|nr:glycosyltransferase family 4 protein [Pseudogulbenkiania subflava]SMF02317.1 Glycosyltransferase involved in cell wall bisynthesis [Pseudogulbenkiania subflava DSM 22618]